MAIDDVLEEELEEDADEIEEDVLSNLSPQRRVADEKTGKIIVSESELRIYARCPYAYYLQNFAGMSKIPLSGTAAKALFFRYARAKLFKVRNKETGRIFPDQRRAGYQLKPVNNMSRDELIEYMPYSSGEAFGNYLQALWWHIAKKGCFGERELVWSFASQPAGILPKKKGSEEEKGVRKELVVAGQNYYEFILEHGAPINGTINKEKTFELEGIVLKAIFPEIRKGMVIDEPSIWGFNAASIYDEESDITTNALITLRILAFCRIAHEFPHFRLKWGISDEDAEMWDGEKRSIDERVRYRHVNLSKNEITEAYRNDAHLDALRRGIDAFLENIARGNFRPKTSSCGGCGYNVLGSNLEPVCYKRNKNVRINVPRYFFLKRPFKIETESKKEADYTQMTLKGSINRKAIVGKKEIDVSEHICSLEIIARRAESCFQATSRYSSRVYGHDFEQRMLAEADAQLQKLANASGLQVVHKIDFDRDFRYAGQRNIAAKISELGYVDCQKTYSPAKTSGKG